MCKYSAVEYTIMKIRFIRISLLLIVVSLHILSPRLSYAGKLQHKSSYRIGVGDKIFISVWKNETLSSTVSVRPDGKVSFFLVDDIMAEGITPMELKNVLTRKLSKFTSTPDVTVIVSEINSMDMYVMGEVIKPGRYNLGKNISLLHILSLAGGIKETADIDSAFLLRNKKKIPINFYKLLHEGDMTQNITLEAYDLLYFPNNFDKNITILGEVNKPSTIPYKKSLRILDVIVLAGGMNKYANPEKIKIIRGNKTFVVDLEKVLDDNDVTANIAIQPRDIIIVSKSIL